MKSFYLTLLSLVFVINLNAQEWLQLFLSDTASLESIERSYNKHFESNKKERGTSFKHFERWAYFNKYDLNLDGSLPTLDQKLKGFQAYEKLEKMALTSNNRSNNQWSPLGPDDWVNQTGWNPGIGRVNEVAVHPNDPNIVFAGTPQGGLWRTNNLGQSWTPLTDFLPSLGVSGIAISPTNPNVMYIGTGDAYGGDSYSTGIYKSMDGGETFERTNLYWEYTQNRLCRKMDIHPQDENIVIASTTTGLLKTTDGGQSWVNVISGNFYDVKFKHGDPSVVYAITPGGFYLSTNGGDSFQQTTDGVNNAGTNRFVMATTKANPNKVYILASNRDNNGFQRFMVSVDGGLSFTTTMERTPNNNILGYNLDGTSEGGQAWYDLALAASPDDENLVFTGGIHIWYTDNGGYTFENLTDWYYPSSRNYVHADIHYLGFWGNRLYSGNDGGIYYTDNRGFVWEDITPGMSINQIYRMSTSPINPSLIAAGSQDNGCNFYINGRWRHLNGGDGMEVAIDPSNSNVLYVASQYGGMRRSTNGGTSFTGIKPPGEEGGWVTPYKISPSNPTILYAGLDNLWRSDNRGTNWEKLTEIGSTNNKITQLTVYPEDHNFVYFTRGSSLYRTFDGGATVEMINSGVGPGTITYVEVSPNDSLKVYLTYGGYNAGRKVFASEDGGASFVDISTNLPPIPVRCITPVKGDGGGLYIGTQFGVFYTDDKLQDWIPFNEGLPTSQVNEIEIQYTVNKVRAATYGRGIWEADLFTDLEIAPIASFESSNTVICEGEQVSYSSTSQFNSGVVSWYFEGGTPETSTDQNVTVTYENTGKFITRLIATNEFSSDTIVFNNFVKVIGENGLNMPIAESFEENFDNQLGELFIYKNSDLWKVSDQSSYEGQKALVFESYNAEEYLTIKSILTDAIELTDIENPIVRFKTAFTGKGANPSVQNRLRVFLSYDCGQTWHTILTKSAISLRNGVQTTEYYIPQELSEWNETVINLVENQLINLDSISSFQLRFDFVHNETSNNLWIDDIFIGNDRVSISETAVFNPEYTVSPNPATTKSVITFKNTESMPTLIKVHDNQGRYVETIFDDTMGIGNHTFDFITDKLVPGVYYIIFEQNGNQHMHKLLVQ